MSRRSWVVWLLPAAGAVLLGGLVAIPGGAAAGTVKYDLLVDCPELETINLNKIICPIRIPDEQDLMGSPSVAVDPRNTRHLVLSSLHGTDANGPSERSRGGQPFTTFVSEDHGGSWFDNPYLPARRLARGSTGEHPQVAIDQWGHLYVGSLYASPENGSHVYTIVAQKFENIDRIVAKQDGNYNAHYIKPIYDGNVIDQFWFVYEPESGIMTIVWGERAVKRPASAARDLVDSTTLPSLADADGRAATGAKKPQSVIGMAWTTPGIKDGFEYIPLKDVVGPCAKTTNPVISEGFIYVGCMVEPGGGDYPWGPTPEEGRIDLFRFDILTDEPQYLGVAPIKGGTPKLGVRSDGRLALVSASASPEGETQLVGVWGKAKKEKSGLDWGPIHRYSGEVSKPRPGFKVLEANVQDVMFREQSGVLHLILKERLEPTTPAAIDSIQAAVDSRYVKTLVAIHDDHGVLAKLPFDIGNLDNRTFLPGVQTDKTNPHGVFNDLADDILQLPPAPYAYKEIDLGTQYQREFFAVGDYGIIIFAEMIEITDLRAPGAPPPQPPAVPLAAPAASLQVSAMLSAVGGGALAGLLALRLVLNRAKDPAAAITKGGR